MRTLFMLKWQVNEQVTVTLLQAGHCPGSVM